MLGEPLYLVSIYYAIYGFYGWICETAYCSAWERRYVRRGFLHGPYCPIYGTGALLVLTLCIPLRENPVLVFCITVIAASVVEYISGWLFETTLQMRLWDYSNNKLNIKGRVCLLNSFLFGILGLAAVYVVHPPTVKLIALVGPETQKIIASCLAAIMGLDFCHSLRTAAGLNERLAAIHAQLDAIWLQRGPTWPDSGDMPENLRRLRQKLGQGLADSPLGRALEKLDALTAQKDASWRIVRNYPTLKPKRLEAELAILRQYWEQDKAEIVKKITKAAAKLKG